MLRVPRLFNAIEDFGNATLFVQMQTSGNWHVCRRDLSFSSMEVSLFLCNMKSRNYDIDTFTGQ